MTICQKISEKYKEMTETAADFRAVDFRQGKSQKEKALELKKRLEISFQGFARRESEITDDTVMCFCGISREITGAWKKIPQNLMWIKGKADFCDSQITNLGQLQSIGELAYFFNSQITDLGRLQSIGGSADFFNSQITDLGRLQLIGGNAHFGDSQITNLRQLQSIGGCGYFAFSQVTDLGQLQSIGGDAVFTDSKIINLGALKDVRGKIFVDKNSTLDFTGIKHGGIEYV